MRVRDVTVGVVLAVAGSTWGYSALSKTVTLSLDGQSEQVSAFGGTVGDVNDRSGDGAGRSRDHLDRGDESIPLARNGLDEHGRIRGIAKRLPDLADGGVDAGLDVDEFAELYTKDMHVREYLSGFVPSAGVATAIVTPLTEPPEGASPLQAMEHRLRTVEGAAAYSLRSHTVEPVFAAQMRRFGVEAPAGTPGDLVRGLALDIRGRIPADRPGVVLVASGGERVTLVAYTHQTVTDKQQLLRELLEIREQGFAVTENQYETGLRGISVPIKSRHGNLVGALSVSMLISACSKADASAKSGRHCRRPRTLRCSLARANVSPE